MKTTHKGLALILILLLTFFLGCGASYEGGTSSGSLPDGGLIFYGTCTSADQSVAVAFTSGSESLGTVYFNTTNNSCQNPWQQFTQDYANNSVAIYNNSGAAELVIAVSVTTPTTSLATTGTWMPGSSNALALSCQLVIGSSHTTTGWCP